MATSGEAPLERRLHGPPSGGPGGHACVSHFRRFLPSFGAAACDRVALGTPSVGADVRSTGRSPSLLSRMGSGGQRSASGRSTLSLMGNRGRRTSLEGGLPVGRRASPL